MNRTARDRVTGFLLRHATAIIFIVVFVYFGVQRRQLLQHREHSQYRQAGVLRRRHRRRHDLRAADRRHRSLGRLQHVRLGDGGRIPAAAARVPGRLRRLRRHRRRARDRRGVRRGQRLLCRGPAYHALPGDACHDGRRARPRHRDHRVLRHRLSRGLHGLRRGVGLRRADPDRRLRDRGRRGASRADPHAIRPAALRRRQRCRGGAEGRHREPTASSSPSTSSAASVRRSAASC